MKNAFKIGLVISSAMLIVVNAWAVEQIAAGEKIKAAAVFSADAVVARQTAAVQVIDAKNASLVGPAAPVRPPDITAPKPPFSYQHSTYVPGLASFYSAQYDGNRTATIANWANSANPYYHDFVDLKTGVITYVGIAGTIVYKPGEANYQARLDLNIQIVNKMISLATDPVEISNLSLLSDRLSIFEK